MGEHAQCARHAHRLARQHHTMGSVVLLQVHDNTVAQQAATACN
uniref:Uncharacterized protein n=1 Tax=Arundo donax TaxID=35708 RepID=A0A0A9D1S3_ARUDO